MQYLKQHFIKSAFIILFFFSLFIFPEHSSVYSQYDDCEDDNITANLTYPYNGNITQALVDRNGGRGNEGIAVWRAGTTRPPYDGDDPYLATNLLPCTDYNYEAYTRNNCAGSDTYGGTFRTLGCTTVVPTLPPPSGQSYTCNANSTLTVRWNNISGASGYIARLDNQGPMSGAPIYNWQRLDLGDQAANTTAINYTFSIAYNTRYQWAVSSVNGSGVGGNWSWNSPAFSCPAPPVPTNTPIPQLQVRIRNPQGAAVTIPNAAYTYECTPGSLCTGANTSNTSSVNLNTIGGWRGGGGITMNSNQRLVGVTPNPGGGTQLIRSGRNNYWWNSYPNTGTRSLYFIVASITPTPTPTRTPTPTPTRTPTPTPTCVPVAAPVISAPIGTIPPGTRAITWSAVTGASGYALRVDNNSVSWSGTCSSINPGDVCQNVSGTSFNYNFTAGTTGNNYRIWVHAISACTGLPGPANPVVTVNIPTYTLTTNTNPAAGGSFQCSTSPTGTYGACAARYAHGTTVYVRANTNPNYNFTGFAAGHGCSSVSSNVCTYAMTANRSITANFALVQRTLTLTANPAAGGSFQCSTSSGGYTNCATSYPHGTTVNVRANRNTNYRFTNWSGSCSGTNNTCTLSMTANRNATANFVLMPDLRPGIITRDDPSTDPSARYEIEHCNVGTGPGGETYTIQVINHLGLTRTVSAIVPPPGTCSTTTTPPVTCASLGDTFGGINCNEDSNIDVTLDINNDVIETDEGNNTTLNNTFSAVASELFYKLKDASLHRRRSVDVGMPAGIMAYDGDDAPTPLTRFVMGAVGTNNSAGVVTSTNTIRIIDGSVSQNNFNRDSYTDNNTYLSSSASLRTFIEYATAQKPTVTINNINEIKSGTVNIFGTGSQTLTLNAQPTATDFVLLVNGNVTITANPTYNTTADNSIAIIATGTITIANNVSTVNAILIGNSVVLGTSTTQLKINGNLISNTPITNITRNRATNPDLQPNLFIVFKPKMYIDLLPQLSDITIEGRQVE